MRESKETGIFSASGQGRGLAAISLAVILMLAGCARVSQKAGALWEGISGEKKDEKTETREEALRRRGYRSLRDEIFLDQPQVSPASVARGGTLKQEMRYSILSPDADKSFTVTEVIVLTGEGLQLELSREGKERAQGTHVSGFQFTLPRDIMPGDYQLTTSVITGRESRSTAAKFRVKR